MKRKIIIVTSEFGKQGGGLSNSALIITQILTNLGLEVEIIISCQSTDKKHKESHSKFKITSDTVSVLNGGYNGTLSRDLFFIGHLKNVSQIIQENLPDLIIAFGAGLNGLFASELSKILNVKLVVMPRGSELNLAISSSDLFHYNQQCLKQAIAVVCVSNELLTKAKALSYSPRRIFRVIPNTISFQDKPVSRRPPIDCSTVIMGTGARYLNEKKGISNLISALAILNDKSNIKFNLHLSGHVDPDLKLKYEERISSLNLDSYVTFLGMQSRNDFLTELASWDIALQCSFCEGFSNSIGDAISIGNPFLISNTGFISECIKAKYQELLFSSLSPDSIAEKIYDTFFHKNIYSLCKSAVDDLKNFVAEEAVASQWSTFLREIFSIAETVEVNYESEQIISLLLHDLSPTSFTGVDLPYQKLSELCERANSLGFRFCSAEEYFNSEDKHKLVICTFDDGYKSVLQYGLPILRQYSFTATVFVCSDHIGKSNTWNPKDKTSRFHMSIEELQILKSEGWEIGSHGVAHISFLRLSENEIEKSLADSKKYLGSAFGDIHSFAYPYGDTSPFVEGIVKKHFRNIFTTDLGGSHVLLDRHRIKRYTFDEIQKLFST